MSRARAVGFLCAVALAVTGLAACSSTTDDGAAPTTSASTTPTPGAAATAGVAPDQQFTFDQVAGFPDGLSVSMGGAEVRQALANESGAQTTGGQLVVVSIVIDNEGDQEYDPRSAVISAFYGADGTPATMITDSTAELQSGFAEVVPAGEEGTTAIGFAVPDAGLGELTVVVDLNDEVNEPISFSGPVEKT